VPFRQAIVQSLPAVAPQSRRRADAIAAELRALLGADPAVVPVARLLDAQRKMQSRHGDPRTGEPAFQLVADGELVAPDPIAAARAVPMLAGTTADEAAAMLDGDAVAATRELFDVPTDRLADHVAGQGELVQRYRFCWAPPGAPYGACHCMELPVLFGTGPAWRDAPMLAGQQPPAELVGRVQDIWSGFVRGELRPVPLLTIEE
jgi:para-nitrobenzyl esterase